MQTISNIDKEWELFIPMKTCQGSRLCRELHETSNITIPMGTLLETQDAMRKLALLVQFQQQESRFLTDASPAQLDKLHSIAKEFTELTPENPVYLYLDPIPELEQSVAMFQSGDSIAGFCHFHARSENQWFIEACIQGRLHVVQWYVKQNPRYNYSSGFVQTCEHGHLDILQWLASDAIIHLEVWINDAFLLACAGGQLKVAQWLWGLDLPINIHYKDEYPFREACWNGHLDVAQWLWSLDKDIDLHCRDDELFWITCKFGHFETAKWLQTLEGIDIPWDYTFTIALEHCHWELAKWLHSFGMVDIHQNDDYAFRMVCRRNHLKVAQWMYSLEPIAVPIMNQAFKEACEQGHFEIVQWIWKVDKDINIHKDEEYPHRRCQHHNL